MILLSAFFYFLERLAFYPKILNSFITAKLQLNFYFPKSILYQNQVFKHGFKMRNAQNQVFNVDL
jgi:hypothetical protein